MPTTTKLGGRSRGKVKATLKLHGTVLSSAVAPGSVTISKTHLAGGTWKRAGSVSVAVVGGRFNYSFKPKHRGRWRFVATYLGKVVGVTDYKSSRSGVKQATVK